MTQHKIDEISAVVFDAYGTLFNLDAMTATARESLDEKAQLLIGLWRQKQLEYSWLRSLMGRHADFWEVTGEALDYALAAMGTQIPGLRHRLMSCYLTPTAYPEALDVLTRLKSQDQRLAILSNGTPAMLDSGTKAAGMQPWLDAVLSVESVGVFKPHPSVYKLATDHFKLPPEQIAFVSSNGWDVAGAAAFGFQVIWVNRMGQPQENLPAVPTATLPNLSSLPELLS